ncbi:MAG: uroporphyrinogen decarboxylase [Dethiosulfovibrio peptidovorans]|nr:MAG: uroporphyrinogen decarboxylase [Dethiosulfovibrio peptidovorans]
MERVRRALAFQETDRIPYSLWMHYPNRDRHPRRLAELACADQKKYDLDFVKFMPYGMYSTVDFGMDLDVFSGFVDPPVGHKPLIETAKDWDKIRPVSGTEGEFAIVLEAQRIFFGLTDQRIPFLQTVFSPLTTALKMCGGPALLKGHLDENPEKVCRALEIITKTTRDFAQAAVSLGADGLFFASQMSSYSLLTVAEHERYVKTYDMEILNAVAAHTWFNVLHLHGSNVMIKEVQEYPVHALSWHDRDDGPSMDEVRSFSEKAFVGGLSWGENWLGKTDAEVEAEVREVAARHEGKGILLGPGCVISPSTPPERLDLVRRVVCSL